MNPMDVLAPNNMAGITENRGIDQLTTNTGLGVQNASAPANPQGATHREQTSNPEMFKDRLRTASARQFGMTKSTVGF